MRKIRSRPLRVLRVYLCVLPLAAMATFYLLLADSFTASSVRDLADARFGLPLAWVQQDLSRYEPTSFPVTMSFHWQRAWYDPIATNYDAVAGVANVLLAGAALTACGYLALPVVRALKRTGAVSSSVEA
ncbi:MAG: hypothetical protein LBE60_00135 [Microbacterium sp.]|uniref:hypothetical protein n=1 Tax=Microbacterium sp. TaxID=51671 RepID=UPI00282F862A|nr:hypothetical protein [Microbacterium sp.]MDR2320039.1 hypothetical protein [Microbacterium sp.]